jgi:hypothetical protein
VPLKTTVQDVQAILEGKYDEISEDHFMFIGAAEEAKPVKAPAAKVEASAAKPAEAPPAPRATQEGKPEASPEKGATEK